METFLLWMGFGLIAIMWMVFMSSRRNRRSETPEPLEDLPPLASGRTSQDANDSAPGFEVDNLLFKSPSTMSLNSAGDNLESIGEQGRKILIVRNDLPIRCFRNERGGIEAEWRNSQDILTPLRNFDFNIDGESDPRPIYMGHPGIRVRPDEKEPLTEMLWSKFRCIPVMPRDETFDQHSNGFCRTVLWPLFHYMTSSEGFRKFDRNQWQAYTAVNNIFAKEIVSHVEDGDLVWVNDYHLCLLPALLRKKIPHVNVGFFLHTPWPSSELFRTLPVRKELLQGVLNSNLLAFHTFDYARHFLSSCRRLLDLDLSTTSQSHCTGLSVQYCGRTIIVRCLPGGVDAAALAQLCSSSTSQHRISAELANTRGRRVILGVDELTPLSGIDNKLDALTILMQNDPSLSEKLRLIQYAYPPLAAPNAPDAGTKLQEMVEQINKKYPDVIDLRLRDHPPSDEELCSVMKISDVMLVTSLWDGLNLVPYMFIAVQQIGDTDLLRSPPRGNASSDREFQTNIHSPDESPRHSPRSSPRNSPYNSPKSCSSRAPTTDCYTSHHHHHHHHHMANSTSRGNGGRGGRHGAGVVICSEFSGCSRSLSAVMRVNPWSVDSIVEALHSALTMEQEERIARYRRQIKYVSNHTVFTWATSFTKDLQSAAQSSTHLKHMDLGFGAGSRIFYFGHGFQRLTVDTIVYHYRKAKCRLLLFDYDGTLVPLSQPSELAHKQNAPSSETLAALHELTADDRNTVFVLSGRPRKMLEKWFASCPGLGLAAEHGFAYRLPHEKDWRIRFSQDDLGWKDVALEVIRSYTERTDGSYIEDKESGVVWHYEDTDIDFGEWQAKELVEHLTKALANEKVTVLQGEINKIVEVEPAGMTKGNTARLLFRYLNSGKRIDDQSKAKGIWDYLPKYVWPFRSVTPARAQRLDDNTAGKDVESLPVIDFVLCVGDDCSDEDMFAAVKEKRLAAGRVFTCTVGPKPSEAEYYVNDQSDVGEILDAFSMASKYSRSNPTPIHTPKKDPSNQLMPSLPGYHGGHHVPHHPTQIQAHTAVLHTQGHGQHSNPPHSHGSGGHTISHSPHRRGKSSSGHVNLKQFDL
eukprot:TRINITY_DN1529_c0_g1::TRINITY_DN1529_c0_g1_i1::g.28146::m.28146 TRINITY_DN1529_c0_g1::TRINITY_DN1529_c0_g1_i1::g.28146  ORF type:complete len:1116 (+),score=75.54,sp/Q9ZV48/TPS11_ARATH/38.12/1e-81,sp/Q9ZV48/TPS11_ARATH/33.89/5e-69,Glyco_transf_20/PF00982.16/1e-101,Glyco_transf_20/PF00982.16/4e-19,Trehalose_PPase/PF02358.11/6.1e-48,Trehalose_PPase/PF02358.11/1.3e-08 TRINITY_DN1529_c0_g1_i1:89-3349(+)